MFLERILIFILQLRERFKALVTYLVRETNSQSGLIFFSCWLLFLNILLYYAWVIIPSVLWIKLVFSLIYVASSLVCIIGIYFIVNRKGIRKKADKLEVYSLSNEDSRKFDTFNLKAISLTDSQVEGVYKTFTEKHLRGSFQSFRALHLLYPIPETKRLVWTDSTPKRPKEVNRQTLLEFLSQLLIGFENLQNQQMLELVEHYFILLNSAGEEHKLSTKNISDWKNNQAAYLKHISRLFQENL